MWDLYKNVIIVPNLAFSFANIEGDMHLPLEIFYLYRILFFHWDVMYKIFFKSLYFTAIERGKKCWTVFWVDYSSVTCTYSLAYYVSWLINGMRKIIVWLLKLSLKKTLFSYNSSSWLHIFYKLRDASYSNLPNNYSKIIFLKSH